MTDLTALADAELVKVLARAECSLAMVEPLRWKHDEAWVAWSDARALVRRLEAELLRRVSDGLEGITA